MAELVCPNVFISYSHDSTEHADRVLALADALRDNGIDVVLDQYIHPAPAEGWTHWMDHQIDAADFVLLICTEVYRRRVMGHEKPGKGKGVRWEGTLIYNRIYNDEPSGTRFVPVLLDAQSPLIFPTHSRIIRVIPSPPWTSPTRTSNACTDISQTNRPRLPVNWASSSVYRRGRASQAMRDKRPGRL